GLRELHSPEVSRVWPSATAQSSLLRSLWHPPDRNNHCRHTSNVRRSTPVAPGETGAGAGGGVVMDFYAVLDQIVDLLRRRSRVSYRALQRQFGLNQSIQDWHSEAR